jgi:hypothetical protein
MTPTPLQILCTNYGHFLSSSFRTLSFNSRKNETKPKIRFQTQSQFPDAANTLPYIFNTRQYNFYSRAGGAVGNSVTFTPPQSGWLVLGNQNTRSHRPSPPTTGVKHRAFVVTHPAETPHWMRGTRGCVMSFCSFWLMRACVEEWWSLRFLDRASDVYLVVSFQDILFMDYLFIGHAGFACFNASSCFH